MQAVRLSAIVSKNYTNVYYVNIIVLVQFLCLRMLADKRTPSVCISIVYVRVSAGRGKFGFPVDCEGRLVNHE